MPETLSRKTCRECRKRILVAESIPHPLEDDATGMPATRWDTDRGEDYFCGWICRPCAFARVGKGLPGAISGPALMFHY